MTWRTTLITLSAIVFFAVLYAVYHNQIVRIG